MVSYHHTTVLGAKSIKCFAKLADYLLDYTILLQ